MPQTLTPEIWEEIKRAYETSAESVKEIATRFGVSPQSISAQVTPRGWKPRPFGAAALLMANAKLAAKRLEASFNNTEDTTETKAAAPRLSKVAAGGSSTHRRALIARLYNLLDGKLTEMEERVQSKSKITGLETEREARQLGNLIKTFEKLTDLSDANVPTSKRTPETDSDEPERLRQDIVRRFDRLCLSNRERPPPVGPETA